MATGFSAAALGKLSAALKQPAAGAGEGVREIPLDLIDPDPNQPRSNKEEGLESLAASIKRFGVLQPIGVRPTSAGRFMIRYGERRWRAAKLARNATIRAFIVEGEQDTSAAAVVENQQRVNLSNLDVAKAVDMLKRERASNSEVASVVNIKEESIKYYRALLELPGELSLYANRGTPRAVYELLRLWAATKWEKRAGIVEHLSRLDDDTQVSQNMVAEIKRNLSASSLSDSNVILQEQSFDCVTNPSNVEQPKARKGSFERRSQEPPGQLNRATSSSTSQTQDIGARLSEAIKLLELAAQAVNDEIRQVIEEFLRRGRPHAQRLDRKAESAASAPPPK